VLGDDGVCFAVCFDSSSTTTTTTTTTAVINIMVILKNERDNAMCFEKTQLCGL
jgi:hypothetical protein